MTAIELLKETLRTLSDVEEHHSSAICVHLREVAIRCGKNASVFKEANEAVKAALDSLPGWPRGGYRFYSEWYKTRYPGRTDVQASRKRFLANVIKGMELKSKPVKSFDIETFIVPESMFSSDRVHPSRLGVGELNEKLNSLYEGMFVRGASAGSFKPTIEGYTLEEAVKILKQHKAKEDPHAENKKLYAEDEKRYKEPWKNWQHRSGDWDTCVAAPVWASDCRYRQKPPVIKNIAGHQVKVGISLEPLADTKLYSVNLGEAWTQIWWLPEGSPAPITRAKDMRQLEAGFLHFSAEDAIAHSKALFVLIKQANGR